MGGFCARSILIVMDSTEKFQVAFERIADRLASYPDDKRCQAQSAGCACLGPVDHELIPYGTGREVWHAAREESGAAIAWRT